MRKRLLNTSVAGRTVCLLAVLLVSVGANARPDWLPKHPRLLFTGSEETAVRQMIKTDPVAGELAVFLKAQADSIAEAEQIPYQMDKYGNMLWTSRAYVYRLGTLSLAYRLYGDRKYLNAADKTLRWVCAYPDWDPRHYLDTSEMTTAVAIAYDWLYDALSPSTRKLVKECLYKRAITTVLNEYRKGGPGSWAKRETNWNVVCNTGMVMGALAVAEDYPAEADTILNEAGRYMPNCLKHFAPDGVCYEGPAYWGYTNAYLSLYLKAVTDNGGDKAGIGRLPGIPKTALYQKRTLTPSGRIFNFGNASPGQTYDNPAYFLYSKLYNQPEVGAWFRNEVAKTIRSNQPLHQLFFLSLPWFEPVVAATEASLPAMEVYHNSINDIVVFNGDRRKKGSVFLIAKGGEPRQAHQHLDCGTFIVESDSVCWTEDLGSDDYSLPGFWDGKVNGKRWTYFRNNNLSHNTLSIDGGLQRADGEAFVCEENAKGVRPYAKLDMTSVYKDKARKVHRKFTLIDDYTMEVRDDIRLLDARSKVSWIACTKAEVKTVGNTAYFTKDGKRFYMQIVAPTGAVFKTYPARNTSDKEYPIEGVTMLEAVCGFDEESGEIVVRMSSRESVIDRFKVDHGPYLQEVTADGATFVFNTSLPSFAQIELRKAGEEKTRICTGSKYGQNPANVQFFGIRAEELQPGTEYRYRIRAKEMVSFQPYKVVFGDSLVSPWYTFRTVDPKQKGGSVFITSDMHSRPQVLKQLLEQCDYRTCTSFFYVGDMMNYMEHGGEHPFTSFIDTSVSMFASSIPFELVRGNHETRGDMARIFPSFFPKRNEKIYGAYSLGDVMIIMLDSGEDKAESHPVYAGLTDYDAYRTEQAEWLKQVLKSKDFKKARYRIVLSHFPLVMAEEWQKENMWYGWKDACDKFLPVINKADVDLVVSGHTHRFFFHEAGEAGNRCPILEQGAMCATRLDLKDGKVQVKVVDADGKVLMDKILSK